MLSTITRTIALHEAGHAVVAHALGVRGLALVVRPEVEGFACAMELPETLGPIEHWTMAAVSLAGGAAEVQDGGEGSSPGDGALEDLQRAVEHLAAWLGLDYVPLAGSGIIEPHLAEVAKLTTALLAVRWSEVLALADLALSNGGKT